MILRETSLTGAFVVELERLDDERGHFARTFDREQFAAAGLDGRVAQASTSFNLRAGTLRGMHYQAEPHAEAKLVRATRGAVYDVIVDLRSGSPTRCQWFAVQLDAETGRALYVPPGFAHGFQTYVSDAARGVRFDDPVFAIEWPAPPTGKRIVSQRDREFADYEPA
jgi:dTDP-4-dehydrorhamnose 3,5-epimerase